jgi:hypothetical protein
MNYPKDFTVHGLPVLRQAQDDRAPEHLQADPPRDFDAWARKAAWAFGAFVGCALIAMFALGAAFGAWLGGK